MCALYFLQYNEFVYVHFHFYIGANLCDAAYAKKCTHDFVKYTIFCKCGKNFVQLK